MSAHDPPKFCQNELKSATKRDMSRAEAFPNRMMFRMFLPGCFFLKIFKKKKKREKIFTYLIEGPGFGMHFKSAAEMTL